jgi:PhnB protein
MRAVLAGATRAHPVADQFYGDRVGVLKDPFGHSWSFASRIEDLTPEEMRRRAPKAAA